MTAPGVSAISAASESGTTVTITTTATHGLVVGQSVAISGVGVSGYNGTFAITAVLSAMQVSPTLTRPPAWAASSGGWDLGDATAVVSLLSIAFQNTSANANGAATSDGGFQRLWPEPVRLPSFRSHRSHRRTARSPSNPLAFYTGTTTVNHGTLAAENGGGGTLAATSLPICVNPRRETFTLDNTGTNLPLPTASTMPATHELSPAGQFNFPRRPPTRPRPKPLTA